MKIKFIILCTFIFCFNSTVFAKCNFNISKQINKLSNPKSISSIEINVTKSSAYFKNAFKIFSLRSMIIFPKLKKKFKASLKVNYKFGTCIYAARIRQHGDSRDHIKLIESGNVIRSLDVKLKEGNILNAVRFKLLLPETRYGSNEVLTSLILREIGIISPETFEVQTSVNGIKTTMLFQENAEKELLERNNRREGPIFEGDENLFYSYRDLENIDRIVLSRLENRNWFKKGITSQEIVLNAHSELQESYLEYSARRKTSDFQLAIFPNKSKSKDFINYNYIILAMNGFHALYVNNRKYYYNTIEGKFEPIYYDGMTMFSYPLNWEKKYKKLFPKLPEKKLLDQLSAKSFYEKIYKRFLERTVLPKDKAKKFFSNSLEQFKNNQKILIRGIKETAKEDKNNSFKLKNEYLNSYREFQKSVGIDQIFITEINYDYGKYIAYSSVNKKYTLTDEELLVLITKSLIKKQKAIYVGYFNSEKIDRGNILDSKKLPGKIIISNGMFVDVNIKKKEIVFNQTNLADWALLNGGDYSDWHIHFNGIKNLNKFPDEKEQRFNNLGLTGCLTIYKSKVKNSTFDIKGGGCEDSINIVNSEGTDLTILINHAYSDAVDFDFSNLTVKKLEVKNSNNDCIDVSMGNYIIEKVIIENCGDKGVSVGEKSSLKINEASILNSKIALAAKDLSILSVNNLKTKNVSSCGEVYQKKQEFGGAILEIKNSNCLLPVIIDQNSTYIQNKK